jgi:hypothetical protein
MADSNTYGYLYQPPSVPRNWNADEKRFYNQLMELFDRLFSMKFGEGRLKKNCITADKIALNALNGIDLTQNQTLIPVIEYLGSENLEKAMTGVTLDGKLVTKVEDLENGTELLQGVSGLQINVANILQALNTYFKFTQDGLEIGKDGEEYHTETTNNGFYIVKGSGTNKLYMVSVTADETKMPTMRAEEHLYIGKPEDGCLEWYKCYNGYGLRRVQPIVEGSGE